MIKRGSILFSLALLALLAAACAAPVPTSTPQPTASDTPQLSATATQTSLPTDTSTPTLTSTPSPTPEPSPTVGPTTQYEFGVINVGMASCRFGPGGGYLLRTTLFQDDEVEILGHMELNENWWFMHTVEKPNVNCWVSQELVDFSGNLARIFPIEDPHLVLPYTSQPYDPLKGVGARRNGNIVTVYWEPFDYLPGDDSGQDKYLVESWVCQNGTFVFRAYSTNNTFLDIQDETTCSEDSHGRAFGSDKHGYTGWVQVPWP
jgi:hypothetical protein